MAKIPYISIRVGEKMPIGLRYSSPDLSSGETISSVEATVDPATGLTLSGDEVINDDGDEVSQLVIAVTAGDYTVTFAATTSAGYIFIDDYEVKVRS